MKIAVTSDVHLEFGDLDLHNDENADVLILSGDICVAADLGRPDPYNIMEGSRSSRVIDFFTRCSFSSHWLSRSFMPSAMNLVFLSFVALMYTG
jgi:3',5'-cyclic AMP phosphodiesterase CpdA